MLAVPVLGNGDGVAVGLEEDQQTRVLGCDITILEQSAISNRAYLNDLRARDDVLQLVDGQSLHELSLLLAQLHFLLWFLFILFSGLRLAIKGQRRGHTFTAVEATSNPSSSSRWLLFT